MQVGTCMKSTLGLLLRAAQTVQVSKLTFLDSAGLVGAPEGQLQALQFRVILQDFNNQPYLEGLSEMHAMQVRRSAGDVCVKRCGVVPAKVSDISASPQVDDLCWST